MQLKHAKMNETTRCLKKFQLTLNAINQLISSLMEMLKFLMTLSEMMQVITKLSSDNIFLILQQSLDKIPNTIVFTENVSRNLPETLLQRRK